ncbi:hypothetical protein [Streptomyces sennicomposti]
MHLPRAAAAALAALLLPLTAHTATAATATAVRSEVRAPGETVTLPVRDAPGQLPVRVENRTGYERWTFRFRAGPALRPVGRPVVLGL